MATPSIDIMFWLFDEFCPMTSVYAYNTCKQIMIDYYHLHFSGSFPLFTIHGKARAFAVQCVPAHDKTKILPKWVITLNLPFWQEPSDRRRASPSVFHIASFKKSVHEYIKNTCSELTLRSRQDFVGFDFQKYTPPLPLTYLMTIPLCLRRPVNRTRWKVHDKTLPGSLYVTTWPTIKSFYG